MRVLCIMPNIDGIEVIIDEIRDQINDTVDLRTNYMQAKSVVGDYETIIVHQLVTPSSPLQAHDFDGITDINPNAQVIPLINGEKDSALVKGLFSLGLYDALFFEHSDANSIVDLINNPRERGYAKQYYSIQSSDKNEIDSSIVSDAMLKRTIDYYKASEKIEESFAETAKTLNNRQMLYLVESLPEEIGLRLHDNELFKYYKRILNRNENNDSKTIIIEKTKTEIKEIEKTEVVNNSVMRRKLFTVMGNSELCAELAYVTAKYSQESILVIDLDTFTPEIANIYGMKETTNSGISIRNIHSDSAFLQAYEVASSRQLNYDILRSIGVKYKFDNLHVLTGNDIIQKAEIFNVEPLKEIIEVALSTYSVVFVNIQFDPYKTMNLFMMIHPKSTVLVPFNGGAIDLINKKRMVKFVRETNKLEMTNLKYIAFEYNSSNHIDEKELRKLTSSQFIGSIQFDHQRVRERNDFHSTHVTKLSRKNEDEYREIITRLGIPMKVSLGERFDRLLRRKKW